MKSLSIREMKLAVNCFFAMAQKQGTGAGIATLNHTQMPIDVKIGELSEHMQKVFRQMLSEHTDGHNCGAGALSPRFYLGFFDLLIREVFSEELKKYASYDVFFDEKWQVWVRPIIKTHPAGANYADENPGMGS